MDYDDRSAEDGWRQLGQVAVTGAEFDSRERQPHPKCLQGTRLDLLNHISGLLDNSEKSQLIWLHGTAGVGKSAVAFTVAERMRDLKVATRMTNETRLAGTFFFSRKYAKRNTTGYFFATLAYQLARNFPSIREDLSRAIREDPTLLDPDSSLHGQMNTLFLQPLLKLRFRLRDCPPLVFVVDALDECTSEAEIVDLISLLGQALCDPDLPVIRILFTSRSERYIRNAFQEHGPLVYEIPTNTVSEEGLTTTISLNGADVDNDIYIFMEHSFARLGGSSQPTKDELVRLVSRAGRRFIVASKMMKFIDDGGDDSCDRLQLMLESPELLRLLELQDPQENEKEELKAEQREYPASIDPLQSNSPVTPETMLQDLTVYITKVDDHPIARGGFGEVWRCTYEMDGRVINVAVKALLIYTSDQDGDGEALEKKTRRILRELRICARLEHRNVLPVYGYANGFGILMAIVSPWAENGNLTTYLEKKSVELDIVRRFQILRDITDGLQYLHTNNIIHGDLTGPNVLVLGDGTACLADFGLSLMYSEVISPSVASWTSSCHGNFRWMAPELLREQDDGLPVRPTKLSDIYSFGGIMLQVLSNKIPYYYLSDAVVIRYIYDNVTPARSRYPVFSDKYWYFIGECWSRTPQDRPPTERVVEVIKNELDSLSSSSTGS